MTKILAIALAVALALLAVQTQRVHTLQLAAANDAAALADANANAERVARETSTSIVDVLFDAGATYQQGLTDAQASSDRDAIALRDGTLRLRREWAACETGRLADGTVAGRRLEEAVERRNALARAAVRVGVECDAKERSLIAAYDGVRKAINEAKR